MNDIAGVGGWIWHAGDFADKAPQVAALGLDYVLVKITDGANPFGPGPVLRTVCSGLAAHNIRLFGWGYIRPVEGAAEGRLAAIRAKALNLEYFSADFEVEFERADPHIALREAQAFISAFKNTAPEVGLIGSSFYRPSLHAGIPWTTFLNACDYWQPQCYWESHPYRFTLGKAFAEGQQFHRPIVTTLPSYDMRAEGGTLPTTRQLVDAAKAARQLGAAAVDFYSLDDAHRLPALWNGIRDAVQALRA